MCLNFLDGKMLKFDKILKKKYIIISKRQYKYLIGYYVPTA